VLDALSTPSCQNTSASTVQPESVAMALPCDSGGGTRTFSIAVPPAHGGISAFNTSTGDLTYTPAPGFHGSDSFAYRVSNEAAASSAATATLGVKSTGRRATALKKCRKKHGKRRKKCIKKAKKLPV
jgi:hypothetical protein